MVMAMADTKYHPVSCDMYANLELFCMRKQPCRVAWFDQGDHFSVRIERVVPTDLQTANQEEFLILEKANGELTRLRLDWIKQIAPLENP